MRTTSCDKGVFSFIIISHFDDRFVLNFFVCISWDTPTVNSYYFYIIIHSLLNTFNLVAPGKITLNLQKFIWNNMSRTYQVFSLRLIPSPSWHVDVIIESWCRTPRSSIWAFCSFPQCCIVCSSYQLVSCGYLSDNASATYGSVIVVLVIGNLYAVNQLIEACALGHHYTKVPFFSDVMLFTECLSVLWRHLWC